MADEKPGEKRSRIFPGKGSEEPKVEEDQHDATKPVTKPEKGTIYKGGKKYDGKHKK